MSAFWKTRFGHCIYQTANIAVYQNWFYRWLTFESPAIQTLMNRHQPGHFSLQYLKPFTLGVRTNPGPCCLLGLGGGGVIHATQSYLQQNPITAVELNEHVIQIANEYFMLEKIKNLDIIHQDANLFVSTTQHQYQHLLVDLCLDSGMPACCEDADFLIYCQQILLKNGLISMNFAYIDDAWRVLKQLRQQLGQNTLCIPIKKTANIVILSSQTLLSGDWFTQWLQSGELTEIIWDSQWGYVGRVPNPFIG